MKKIMTCAECNGECCNDIAVEIDAPTNFEDFETIKWMIAHQNVKIYLDCEGDWLVEFKTKCNNLDENNFCKVYKERYPVCRGHDPEECIINGEGELSTVMFEKDEDVNNYMKKIGYYETYLKMKNKMIDKS